MLETNTKISNMRKDLGVKSRPVWSRQVGLYINVIMKTTR